MGAFVARGELTRMLQYSDLGVEVLPNEGPQGAKFLRVTFRYLLD